MDKKSMLKKTLIGIATFKGKAVYAAPVGGASGLGKMADNLFSAEKSAQSFLQFLCIVVGAALLLGSIGQFKAHWKNPVYVRLSKPIAMVFLGLALIILGFIPMGVN